MKYRRNGYNKPKARGKKYSAKLSKKQRERERLHDTAANLVAVILLVILLFLIANLVTKKRVHLEQNAQNLASVNISYNDYAKLKELGTKYSYSFPHLLAYYFAENDFFTNQPAVNSLKYIEDSFVSNFEKIKPKYYANELTPIAEMFEEISEEIQYFPIPTGYAGETGDDYMYSSSWGAKRDYGGDRTHLGCDIIDKQNKRGRIPIISMTDGVIEHIGWNELGGYRVGVRTDGGNYYYYAHLSEFAPRLATGSVIEAGTLIGFMGDTGYSKKEGTTGNFVVHLHVGISYQASFAKGEYWINPYVFLQDAESKRLIFY